jgi:hypothetical protein
MMRRLLFLGFVTVLFQPPELPAQTGIQRIWAVDDGERIKKTELNHPLATSPENPVWDGTRISLFGGRNEVVAFQLILQGNATGATAVNVTLDSLHTPGPPAYTIRNTGGFGDPYNYTGKRIEMFVQQYMNITERTNASYIWWSAARPLPDAEFTGLQPEILVPFEAPSGARAHGQGGAPFSVAASQNQGVWVDVYIPRDARPGRYTGSIAVVEGLTQRASIPVELRVFAFTLPDTSHLRNAFLLTPEAIAGKHGLSQGSTAYWDMVRRYYAMFYRHRANAQHTADTATFRTHLGPLYSGSYFTQSNAYEGPGEGVGPNYYQIGAFDQPSHVPGTTAVPEPWYEIPGGDFHSIRNRGGWSAGSLYAVNDIVRDDDYPYFYWCKLAHTASGLNEPIESGSGSSAWSRYWVRLYDRGSQCGFDFDPDTSVMRGNWWRAADWWVSWFEANNPSAWIMKYGPEEPNVEGNVRDTSAFADLRRKARWLRTNPSGKVLKLRTATTYQAMQWPVLRQLDIVYAGPGQAPEWGGYVLDSARAYRGRGVRTGLYGGTRPHFGTNAIDAPATEQRMIPWAMWKYGVTEYSYWKTGVGRDWNPWDRDRNAYGSVIKYGDGTLVYDGRDRVYPEEDRGLDGPVAGIRLKNWRRGAQDFEYLYAAQSRGLLTAPVVDSVIPAAFDELQPTTQASWASRGFRYERARRTIAELLDTLAAEFPTGTFALTPDTLPAAGGTVQLSWTSRHATEATLESFGTVPLNGSLDVPVTSARTFRLTLRNAAGSQTLTATVHVGSSLPDPEGTFIVSPDTLPPGGGTATLIWVSTNAVSATMSHGIGAVPLNGSRTVAVDTSTTFTLTLDNGVSQLVRQARVAVAVAPPAPAGTFFAVPDSLPPGGGTAQLVWTSANASAALLQPGIGPVPLTGSRAVSVESTRTYTLSLSGPSGTNILSATVRVAGLPPPPSGTFAATPDTLPPGGGNVTLTWSSAGATSASISNAVGVVPLNGSLNLNVTGSTVYRLTLGNAAGTQTLEVLITVRSVNGPPTGTFVITPDTLPAGGGNATLVWVSEGAISASLDNGIGVVPLTGTRIVPVDGSRRFLLTLQNGAGLLQLSATAVVSGSVPPPEALLLAAPDSLPAGGGEAKLIWYSSNGDSVFLEPAIGNVPPQGALTVTVPATRTYTLTAINASGTTHSSATVAVALPPPVPTGTILAVPDTLPEGGGNTTLIWVSEGAVSAQIDQGIGVVPVNGTRVYSLSASATFRLRLANPGGTADRTVRVTVRSSPQPTPSVSLQASPDSLGEGGGDVQLTWSSTDADSVIISPEVGAVAPAGSVAIPVGSTRMFIATAVNRSGRRSDSALVVVAGSAAGPQDITAGGLPVAFVTAPVGAGSRDIGVIRDGLLPPVGSTNTQEQFATFNGAQKEFDWVGYEFDHPRSIGALLFQEGMHFHDGGWFEEPRVEVRVGGAWTPLDSVVFSPPYGGGNGVHYETFDLVFPPVAATGVRIAGRPGGAGRYISVGELRAFAVAAPGAAPNVSLALTPPEIPPDGGDVQINWCISGAPGGHLEGVGAVEVSGMRTVRFAAPATVTLTASNANGTTRVTSGVMVQEPQDFWLEQNYPNPFNPATSIRFTVHRPGSVRLVVFDLLGRPVRELFSGQVEAGYRVVEWDGRDDRGVVQSSGVYFYRFEAEGFTEVKRMIMMR